MNVLVGATIHADDAHRYAVMFRGSDRDDACIKLVLHYYASVLYELGRAHAIDTLPNVIDRATTAKLSRNLDVFTAGGVRGALVANVAQPIGSVDITLVADQREIVLDGEIHMSGNTLAYSVCALLESVLQRISPDGSNTLLVALANMNASYGVTHSYSDPVSRREVPMNAYLAAAFV